MAVYGYNGEYTHESLRMQYLRVRYLNMATGTFLSRDTYGGAMDNILSQNRYTYVGNNPVNYADPDGHKALGSTIKNTFSAIADAARNGARNAQNQSGLLKKRRSRVRKRGSLREARAVRETRQKKWI